MDGAPVSFFGMFFLFLGVRVGFETRPPFLMVVRQSIKIRRVPRKICWI